MQKSGMLRKGGCQVVHQGNVQTVRPEHRALGVFSVVVPSPCRRNDEVTGVHECLLPVHGRMCAYTFDEKARGLGGMACAMTVHNGVRPFVDMRLQQSDFWSSLVAEEFMNCLYEHEC